MIKLARKDKNSFSITGFIDEFPLEFNFGRTAYIRFVFRTLYYQDSKKALYYNFYLTSHEKTVIALVKEIEKSGFQTFVEIIGSVGLFKGKINLIVKQIKKIRVFEGYGLLPLQEGGTNGVSQSKKIRNPNEKTESE